MSMVCIMKYKDWQRGCVLFSSLAQVEKEDQNKNVPSFLSTTKGSNFV